MAKPASILTFPDECRDAILTGTKTVAILPNTKRWASALKVRIGKEKFPAHLVDSAVYPLAEVPDPVIVAGGFTDADDMLRGLREVQPDIDVADGVTVLWFELVPVPEPQGVAEAEGEAIPDAPPTVVMDTVLAAKNAIITGIAQVKGALAELEHVIQRDPRFEGRWATIFDAISAANEEAKNIGGKAGKLTELIAAVNGFILDVRKAEEKKAAGKREVACCACGLLSAAAIVVGEAAPKTAPYRGDPFRANEGVCPGCGMSGLTWADAPVAEAPPTEESTPEAPAEEASSPDEPPAEDDGLVGVHCSQNCGWKGRMAAEKLAVSDCPVCEAFVAIDQEE